MSTSDTTHSPDQLPLLTPPFQSGAPKRKIFTETDIQPWLDSEAYDYLETLIARMSYAVDGKSVEDSCKESETVKAIIKFLQNASSWIDTIPLQTTPQRFGNKSFRDWIVMLEENEGDFQLEILQPSLHPILPELSHHFRTSFGSGPRLDYGTGHELSFLAYLLILRLVGVLTAEDEQALVTRVFVAYLEVARKLQKVYRLEPAGSKGVWGLDDHQHLVYLWGASQLRTHPSLRPSAILSPQSISPHAVSYLFLSSILHINDLKTGPFAEHSPMLHNIASTVPNWTKVNSGLMKMYREEVLKKVPVVQHFWFGGILAWRKKGTAEELPSSGDGKEDPEVEVERQRDEGTVAPWTLPTSPPEVTPPSMGSNLGPTRATWTTSSPNLPFQRQTAFSPPSFFPPKTQLRGTSEGAASVADQGGAAAGSSVFGALKPATLGGPVGRVPGTEDK